jgi:MFS family permease
VSTFLRDPTQLGVVTPAIAGQLGSYALFGVLVGALLAGTVGDILGRRKVMLFAYGYAWFSVGMAGTALTSSIASFGIMRFLTGLGVGALVATTAAAQDSPHSQTAPKVSAKTGWSASIAAKRSTSGTSCCSGMFGMRS